MDRGTIDAVLIVAVSYIIIMAMKKREREVAEETEAYIKWHKNEIEKKRKEKREKKK